MYIFWPEKTKNVAHIENIKRRLMFAIRAKAKRRI
jgi:hypothetical protein